MARHTHMSLHWGLEDTVESPLSGATATKKPPQSWQLSACRGAMDVSEHWLLLLASLYLQRPPLACWARSWVLHTPPPFCVVFNNVWSAGTMRKQSDMGL